MDYIWLYMRFSTLRSVKNKSQKNKFQIIFNNQITIFKTVTVFILIQFVSLRIVNLELISLNEYVYI